MSDAFLAADAILSPWLIVALGIAATAASLHLAWRAKERGALILAWGSFNFAIGYFWIYASQPPFMWRALAVRVSIIWVLVSIIYYTGRRSDLFNCLLRYLMRMWGRR